MNPKPIQPKPGEESVWDYPRPPKLEAFNKTIEVYFNKKLIAKTNKAFRVLETSHPPVYYLPPGDIAMEFLLPSVKQTYCEYKGKGSYYHIQVDNKIAGEAAWYYNEPFEKFIAIKNYVAFYANKMDTCTIDGVVVKPQPGLFYGGWITPGIIGPFKGEAGTWGW